MNSPEATVERDSLKKELAFCQFILKQDRGELSKAMECIERRDASILPLLSERDRLKAELEALQDWFAEQLGDWLLVEVKHYPTSTLAGMKGHYDAISEILSKGETK